jgi:predicted component of type VI protein secretion system
MIERSAPSFKVYNWKSLDCELCKRALPISFITCGKAFSSAIKVDSPSLVLESVDREHSTNKGVVALQVDPGTSVKLGRGHESDVRITDISVSRVHCTLRHAESRYMLADETSKFGTLVKLQEAKPLTQDCELTLQAGRTILRIEVRRDNFTRKPNCDSPLEEELV